MDTLIGNETSKLERTSHQEKSGSIW